MAGLLSDDETHKNDREQYANGRINHIQNIGILTRKTARKQFLNGVGCIFNNNGRQSRKNSHNNT